MKQSLNNALLRDCFVPRNDELFYLLFIQRISFFVFKFINQIIPDIRIMIKKDILSPSDVTKLIKTFYDKLLISPIKHHFVDLDLEKHLPRVDAFWCATLFPDRAYSENLIAKHAHLPLKKEEFETWLKLFWETLDELFTGQNVETMKNRSASIAYIMQKKLLKE